MKNRSLKLTLLLIGYCIPFSFLAMYGDVTFDSMWLYGLLAAGFGFLCWGSVRCRSLMGLILGNALSCATSVICVTRFQTPDWAWYFKPFTAMAMVILLSAAVFAVQFAIWMLAWKRRK